MSSVVAQAQQFPLILSSHAPVSGSVIASVEPNDGVLDPNATGPPALRTSAEDRTLYTKYGTGSIDRYSKTVEDTCVKYQKDSRSNKINNLLAPLRRIVGLYMPAISAASQADPNPTCLVVGGIIALLQISEGFDVFQKKITKWLSKLSAEASVLMQFDLSVYPNVPAIQEALVPVYGDILEFCKRARRLYAKENEKRKNSLLLLGKTMTKSFSDAFGEVIDSFDTHIVEYKAQVDLFEGQQRRRNEYLLMAVAMTQSQSLDEQREASAFQFQGLQLQSQMSQQNNHFFQSQMDARNAELKREQEQAREKERQAKRLLVIKWLPRVELQDIHDQRVQSAVSGTGDWFQGNELYQKWRTAAHTDLLWVKGKPGSGKSVLSALTVRELKCLIGSSVRVAYFYCNRSADKTADYKYLLTTMLRQLSNQNTQYLNHELESLYDREELVQESGPGVQDAERVFLSVLSDATEVYLVVDGLDELSDLTLFLKFVPSLMKDVNCRLKVLLFSRDFQEIASALESYTPLKIDTGANADGIKKFISSRLSETDSNWDPRLLALVQEVFFEKADGMFLYVSLTAGRLRAYLELDEILEQLNSLPKGLSEVYKKNLKRILFQDDELSIKRALSVLLWVANAARPLHKDELLEARRIRRGQSSIGAHDRRGTDQDFTTLCAELVSRHQDESYHLVHASFRDYLVDLAQKPDPELQDYSLMQVHAPKTLGEACLVYLLFDKFREGPVASADALNQLKQENPFLSYAAQHWGTHVAQAGEDVSTELAWEFVACEKARHLSLQIILADDCKYPFPGTSSPLHLLAHFGLVKLAKLHPELNQYKHQLDGFERLPLDYALSSRKREMVLWLLGEEGSEQRSEPSVPKMGYFSPFHAAILYEWNDVLDRLILKGYDINHRNTSVRFTPLISAAALGNIYAVTKLLDTGANAKLEDEDGKTALMHAIEEDHTELVRPLLEHGTPVDAEDDTGFTALHLAADTGKIETLTLLLERRAALKKSGEKDWFQSPVHLAAEHDYEEIVVKLYDYDRGCIESECKGGYRPIHVAAWHDSIKVAKRLKALKAVMNPGSDEGKTVLHIAAENARLEFVELILEEQPDVNATEKHTSDTPLHLAASEGKTEICRALLEYGAVVDMPNAQRHTALHRAVSNGHVDTAKLLLDYRFDPRLIAVFNSPVLHYAANEGTAEMIQPLLDHGAEPEFQNLHKDRALHFASRMGNDKFIDQLFVAVPSLEVDATDENGKTALNLAAGKGFLGTINLLKSKGAQDTIVDSSKNLPAHLATWNGHLETLKRLFSDDNKNAQAYHGRTLLNIAATRGHANIVSFLMSKEVDLEIADDAGMTPLINAARMNYPIIAETLAKAGANFKTLDCDKKGVLHRAVRAGNVELVKYLRSFHYDDQDQPIFQGDILIDAVLSNSVDLVCYLIESGMTQVNHRDGIGASCCHIAAEEGNSRILDRLLKAGADPRCIDDGGRTPMHSAASSGRHEMIKKLHCIGLSINGAEGAFTEPLGLACEDGFIKCVDVLIELGADISNPGRWDSGRTPLHLAAIARQPKIIQRLIAQGADLSVRDNFANTPLDYAIKHPASLHAIGYQLILETYLPLELKKRRAMTWTTIRRELQKPTLYATQLTVADEMARLVTMIGLRDGYFYLRDPAYFDTFKYLYMELTFSTEHSKLRLSFTCAICKKLLQQLENSDAWVCLECQHRLCTECHENYKKGWKSPNSAPQSLKELERLEEEIRPFKELMLPIIEEIRVKFVFFILEFFTLTEDWVTKKQTECEEWSSEFNNLGYWNDRKRPGQELLQLIEEGRKLMKKLKEEGESFDEEKDECAALVTKFSTFHRIHNVEKDNDKFECVGHEYLHISKEEYDKLRKETEIFQPDRRLAPSWFGDLLLRCPPTTVETDEATESVTRAKEDVAVEIAAYDMLPVDKEGNKYSEPEAVTRSDATAIDNDATLVRKRQPAEDSEASAIERLEQMGIAAQDLGYQQPQAVTEDNRSHRNTRQTSTGQRPLMPTSRQSTFRTQNVRQNTARQVAPLEQHRDELRSPTDAVAALATMQDAASSQVPENTVLKPENFSIENIDSTFYLKRRVTSPQFSSKGFDDNPFTRHLVARSSTLPLQEKFSSEESFQLARSRIPQFVAKHHIKTEIGTQPAHMNDTFECAEIKAVESEQGAQSAESKTNVSGEEERAESAETPVQNQEQAGTSRSIADGSTVREESARDERPITSISITHTSQFGKLVCLAVKVADSISPEFADGFLLQRLVREDFEDYHLVLRITREGDTE